MGASVFSVGQASGLSAQVMSRPNRNLLFFRRCSLIRHRVRGDAQGGQLPTGSVVLIQPPHDKQASLRLDRESAQFEEPFENLKRSNQLTRRKDDEIWPPGKRGFQSGLLGRGKVHGVGSPDEEVLWRGQYQCACPPQYTFSYEYEVPQPVSDVSGKARGQVTRVGMCVRNFPYSAVKHRMKLGQGPKRRIDRIRIPDEFADAG